jgi:hypothetical protein
MTNLFDNTTNKLDIENKEKNKIINLFSMNPFFLNFMQHMKSSLSVIGIILYAIFDKTTF